MNLPNKRPSITLLGAGAWGSALAKLVAATGHQPRIWSRSGDIDLSATIATDVIISAISMNGVATVAAAVKQRGLKPSVIIVTATKGLDAATTLTPSQIWQKTFPDNPLVVLSGPNLSQEIQAGLPAATVVASTDPIAATTVQNILATERFRVYTNNDPLGTELGGTLKNVMAIAVGVCDGLKLGNNAKSALITRALPEIIRVGTQLGGQAETFWGLAGLGDMLTTCNSILSRNYRVGLGLAEGTPLPQILEALGSTAEGVNTTQVLMTVAAREGLSLPIATQVNQLLQGNITPQEAVAALMERHLKPEMVN